MIQYLGYDSQERQLRILFNGKKVYDYFLVPPDVARQVEVALAGGDDGFFFRSVRGVYPFRRST
mgnify:FL=1